MTWTEARIVWLLPAAVLFQGLLQKIKEFHVFWGTILLGVLVFSIYFQGCSIVHIVYLICIILGIPLLSISVGSATILWLWLELVIDFQGLDFLAKYKLGWIFMIAFILVTNSFLSDRKFYSIR